MGETPTTNRYSSRRIGGGRKDVGHALMAGAGGRSGGKCYSSSRSRGREKGRGGEGRGGHRNRGNSEKQDKGIGGKANGGKSDNSIGDSAKCKRCGETGHKTVQYPIQVCGVCGRKGTQLRYA